MHRAQAPLATRKSSKSTVATKPKTVQKKVSKIKSTTKKAKIVTNSTFSTITTPNTQNNINNLFNAILSINNNQQSITKNQTQTFFSPNQKSKTRNTTSTSPTTTSQRQNHTNITPLDSLNALNNTKFAHVVPKTTKKNQKNLSNAFTSTTTTHTTIPTPKSLNNTITLTPKLNQRSLLPQTHQQRLRKLLSTPHQHVSKRQFMSHIKRAIDLAVQGGMAALDIFKILANPFSNKRGNTIGLGGSVPLQYKIRNALIITGITLGVLGGAYLLIKFAILAMKMLFVYFVFNTIRKQLVNRAITQGDLDKAIMYQTWGESHANDNTVARIMWNINPISWWRRVQHYISLDRRKQFRCQEIADEVIKQLQTDTRLPHIFGNDFVIGEMDRNVGELGIEEEEQYDGFIMIPIYSASPTVIDLDDNNNGKSKKNKKTGTDEKNKDHQQKIKEEFNDEVSRRLIARYGSDPQEHTYLRTMEILEEVNREKLDEIDVTEDIDYDYKYYKSLPRWRYETLPQEEKDTIYNSKKEIFYHNRNIQDRINIMDFDSLAIRWSKLKWNIRQDNIPSKELLFQYTADQDLNEVGMVYAFFTVPAMQNVLKQKDDNKVSINAMNILTQGTLEPFQLEKVFLIGENIDRMTLFHNEVARWSTTAKSSLSPKDRTIKTYRNEVKQAQLNEQEKYFTNAKGEKYQKSGTRIVDFDMESNKPIVEAEFVEAETIDMTNATNNGPNGSSNNGNVVEAEILKK